MERSLLLWTFVLGFLAAKAQPSIHIAFNVGNCIAHSRQITMLGTMRPQLPTVVVLSDLDSAMHGWVIDRFALGAIDDLSFEHLPLARLNRYFSPMGGSTVFLLNGTDTLARFPIEELPAHLGPIAETVRALPPAVPATDGKGSERRRRCGKQRSPDGVHKLAPKEPTDERAPSANPSIRPVIHPFPLSSDVEHRGSAHAVWLLDHLQGSLFCLALDSGSNVPMRNMGTVKELMRTAFGDPAVLLDRQQVEAERIVSIDPVSGYPTILVQCTDTSSGDFRSSRYLLALRDDGSSQLTHVDRSLREDALVPSIGLSGSVRDGDSLVIQVMKAYEDGNGHPLFGYCTERNGHVAFASLAPYDYHSERWPGVSAYQFINGHLRSGWFAFAIAPLLVDLHTWKEQDLSGYFGVSLDSALAMVPGHYYTIDMQADEQGVTLLCQVRGVVKLAGFTYTSEGLRPTRIDVIPRPAFEVRSAVLLDRHTFLFTSAANDRVLIGP